MKIIQYEDKYLDDVKDLLVELEEYIVSIDKDKLDQIHLEYRKKMAILDLEEVKNNNGKCYLALEDDKVIGLIMGCIFPYDVYDYLDYKCPKRAEIAERIKVALGFGDLTENSEYDEAKNAQAANEIKIAELEEKIKYAKIIDESEIDTEVVQVGNKVKVLDTEFDERIEYTIVGTTEADTKNNKISNESPIGKALLGKKRNNIVEVQAPVGIIKLKILSIKK